MRTPAPPNVTALLLAALLLSACGTPVDVHDHTSERSAWFVDRARASGIDFEHVNGMTGRLYIAEIMAPGAALFDFDNDGDLDAYLVQGQPLDPSAAVGSAPRPAALTDRLYRNDLQIAADGSRILRFTDVTAQARIDVRGYGMGVAAGDYDNDGWTDLYLTKFDAPNQLLHNNGNGTFTDVAHAAGTDQRSWSVSASFADIDRDGWLDLYVANYIRYPLDGVRACFNAAGAADYCTPIGFQPLPDRLYRNNGNGTFSDVSGRARITTEFGPALGVAAADVNADGWADFYVANDGRENQLWLNRRDGTFENSAALAGVALPIHGKPEGSMGVDFGDIDDDGDEDLVVTELTGEGANLFVNDGTGIFEDRSGPSGIGAASLPLTGFGARWIDVDNDGRLDLLTVNGAIQMIERLRQASDPLPLRQRKQLLRNLGAGAFADARGEGGEAFESPDVGRGAAFGDVDNDGDLDVLVANNGGRAQLLVNDVSNENGHHWIGLRLVDRSGRRDAIGARVEIVRPGRSLWRRAHADGSYASASDPRVLAGLGTDATPVDVRIVWPDGSSQTRAGVAVDRYTTLRQGEAK